MINFKKQIIISVALIGFLFSQDTEPIIDLEEESNIRIGYGIDAEVLVPIFTTSAGYMYFPIETKKIMIEPLFAYSHSQEESESLGESSETDLIAIIGLFAKSQKTEKIKSYAGIRIGMAVEKEKSIYTTNEYTTKAFLIAPTVGAEYFISESFSFGGEWAIRFANGEKKDQNDDLVEEVSGAMLYPNLIFRYYF